MPYQYGHAQLRKGFKGKGNQQVVSQMRVLPHPASSLQRQVEKHRMSPLSIVK